MRPHEIASVVLNSFPNQAQKFYVAGRRNGELFVSRRVNERYEMVGVFKVPESEIRGYFREENMTSLLKGKLSRIK